MSEFTCVHVEARRGYQILWRWNCGCELPDAGAASTLHYLLGTYFFFVGLLIHKLMLC